jgi:hypothetical protein
MSSFLADRQLASDMMTGGYALESSTSLPAVSEDASKLRNDGFSVPEMNDLWTAVTSMESGQADNLTGAQKYETAKDAGAQTVGDFWSIDKIISRAVTFWTGTDEEAKGAVGQTRTEVLGEMGDAVASVANPILNRAFITVGVIVFAIWYVKYR